MPFTPENAALFAQVIPTLLIALALESRFGPRHQVTRVGKWAANWGRLSAVIAGLGATALSLVVVCFDVSTSIIGPIVFVATAYLLSLMSFLLGGMFGMEASEKP